MLRGNSAATVDDKGRLKIPSNFRRRIEAKYGAEVFVTSLTGDSVWVYPLKEWENIEQRLQVLPAMDQAKRAFLYRANYYGQQTELDAQGRILIPAILRRTAEILGEVAVIGQLHFLEVWDAEKFQTHLENNPFTAEHEAALSRFI
jgi:MraZ protein